MNLIALSQLLCVIGLGSPEGPPSGETPTVEVQPETGEVQPETALDLLDSATACLRRAQLACARDTALRLLAQDSLDGSVLRDGLIVLAQAESLLDHPQEAEAAFRRLFDAGSAWRPDRDADRRVITAWVAAKKAPAPRDPPPTDEIYTPKAFFASVGAGVALPVGAASGRYSAGLAAVIDVGWRWDVPEEGDEGPLVGVVLSFNLASLGLDSAILAENGQATTLRVTLLTAGLDLRIPLAPAWQAVLQGGVGYGTFGIGSASSGPALALQGSVGARWQLADAFALRADFTPVFLVPFKDGVGTAGHPGFTLRAEASF